MHAAQNAGPKWKVLASEVKSTKGHITLGDETVEMMKKAQSLWFSWREDHYTFFDALKAVTCVVKNESSFTESHLELRMKNLLR